ncbi:MAG: tetraacyldisaccharide 4'-kinase [Pseudomonadota bacterium]
MRAPWFWFREAGLLSMLLMPATLLWRLGGAIRSARMTPKKVPVPVICIGNLTAGGAGKTPMVAAWSLRLASQGRTVAVVSRGYGGRLMGPHKVDPAKDRAEDVGDEPLMLAQMATVWVARDRAAGAEAAARDGAEIVLLDDGFQNPGIAKDLSVLVVDAEQGFGNRRIIPAGPLREPVVVGFSRADRVVLIGLLEERRRAADRWPELEGALPACLVSVETGIDLSGQPVVAFAGIGRPEKFFGLLRSLGARLAAAHPFPDHHVYDERVIVRMLREAAEKGAMLITTEKDAIKLPERYRCEVLALPVRLELEDWTELDRLVDTLAPRH